MQATTRQRVTQCPASAMRHIKCELLTESSAIGDFMKEWTAFVDGEVEGLSIENDPRYLLDAAPNSEYWLAVVWCDDKLQAVAAALRQTMTFTVRFSVFSLWSSKKRQLNLCGSSIVMAPEVDKAAIIEVVFKTYELAQSEFDWIHIEGVAQNDPLYENITRVAAATNFRLCSRSAAPEPAYKRHLPPTHEQFMQSISKSTRSSFRRRAKRWLADDGMPNSDLVVCTRPKDVEPLLDGIDRVFRNSWQARTYGFYARYTEHEIERLKRIAARGWLRSYLLYFQGEPIAFELGYQYKGTYYDCCTGYTQTHAHLGPGTALYHVLMLDLYARDTPATLDLGQGQSKFKMDLRADRNLHHPVHLTCRDSERLLIGTQRSLDRLESTIRALLERWRLDRAVRLVLKRRIRLRVDRKSQ